MDEVGEWLGGGGVVKVVGGRGCGESNQLGRASYVKQEC